MVKLCSVLRFAIKIKGGGTLFDDHLRVYVRGGRGGRGLPSCGGVGGEGGDVYFVAKPNVTLTKIKKYANSISPRFIADDGDNAKRIVVVGDKGRDINVAVPMGITIETEDRKLVGELNKKGEKLLVARGGEGGSPKTRFKAQEAVPHVLHLHLKLIADVGFVGFPNAGKSTLLKALSRTNPLISALPFTTLRPQIGIVEYDDFRQISLADLPGLIEGAHLNRGMGYKFLKHVERTMLLMFVVDLNGFQLSVEDVFRNAYETIILLNKELELYNPALLDKPAILVVNKMDTDVNNFKFDKLMRQLERRFTDASIPSEYLPEKFIEFMDVVPMCAKDKDSTNVLKEKLREYLDLIDDLRRKQREGTSSRNKEESNNNSLVSTSFV